MKQKTTREIIHNMVDFIGGKYPAGVRANQNTDKKIEKKSKMTTHKRG